MVVRARTTRAGRPGRIPPRRWSRRTAAAYRRSCRFRARATAATGRVPTGRGRSTGWRWRRRPATRRAGCCPPRRSAKVFSIRSCAIGLDSMAARPVAADRTVDRQPMRRHRCGACGRGPLPGPEPRRPAIDHECRGGREVRQAPPPAWIAISVIVVRGMRPAATGTRQKENCRRVWPYGAVGPSFARPISHTLDRTATTVGRQ